MVGKAFCWFVLLQILAILVACRQPAIPEAMAGMSEDQVLEKLGQPAATVLPPFESDSFELDTRVVKVFVYRQKGRETYKVAFDKTGLVVQTSFGRAIP